MKETLICTRELPDAAGRYSGELLIASSGWTLLDDLAKYGGSGQVMAVNHAGIFVPGIDHWFTCHTDYLPAWEAVRLEGVLGPKKDYTTHALGGQKADILWPLPGRHARTSGMAAVIAAILMGYDKIVLAGLPGDDGGYFFPMPGEHIGLYEKQERNWRLIAKEHPGKVESLSGNTKEWLESGRAA